MRHCAGPLKVVPSLQQQSDRNMGLCSNSYIDGTIPWLAVLEYVEFDNVTHIAILLALFAPASLALSSTFPTSVCEDYSCNKRIAIGLASSRHIRDSSRSCCWPKAFSSVALVSVESCELIVSILRAQFFRSPLHSWSERWVLLMPVPVYAMRFSRLVRNALSSHLRS